MNIKNQAHKFINKMKNMHSSRDINKSPVKYIDQYQTRNKYIYLIKVKRDLQCSFKAMNI